MIQRLLRSENGVGNVAANTASRKPLTDMRHFYERGRVFLEPWKNSDRPMPR